MTAKEIESVFQEMNDKEPLRFAHWGTEVYGRDCAAIIEREPGKVIAACDRFWLCWPELERQGFIRVEREKSSCGYFIT